MKFDSKFFHSIAIGLTAAVTGVLSSGVVPAAYQPFVAGLATLLAAYAQKK